jgi:hypothetical protein
MRIAWCSDRQPAAISQPGEYALAGDDQPVAVGRDGPEEGLPRGGEVLVQQGAPVVVEDAEEHGPGVQVDAAVSSVSGLIEHHEPPFGVLFHLRVYGGCAAATRERP